FLRDSQAIYLDTSPLQLDDQNVFRRNEFRLADTALVFHGSETRNLFEDNVFRDVRASVEVEGRADALRVTFTGNDFDDYAGYDRDGDGCGDLRYERRSLAGELESGHPELRFFEGTPALALVDVVGRALPLFEARMVMRDSHPRTVPPEGVGHAD